MRIVIAPDSFKESLSAPQVAQAIARGVSSVVPQANIISVPMADGGEGSLDAVLAAGNGERRTETVQNALGQHCQADWGLLPNATAFIEMATAAGLAQTPAAQRNPLVATTYGVGQLIMAAVNAGARRIVLALGGSATNDAGAGLIQALGAQLLDAEGNEISTGAQALEKLHRISLANLDPRLADVSFEIAVDVDNPLCGPRGASAIFGPQKGATPEMVRQLDGLLAHFADVVAAQLGHDLRNEPGMGAAGGLGFPVRAFLKGSFRPGVELIADISGLAQKMKGATLAFTGEGRMDSQTLLGKTPAGVARHAARHGVPLIALVGSLGDGYQQLYAKGLTAAFSLVPGPLELSDALANAGPYLEDRAANCMRLWLAARGELE